jgi:hypothetical protein
MAFTQPFGPCYAPDVLTLAATVSGNFVGGGDLSADPPRIRWHQIAESPRTSTIAAWHHHPAGDSTSGICRAGRGCSAKSMRTRELQAMRWADEVLIIADDRILDPHDRRIRVDTRKWLLSKMLPRIYGDKVTLTGGAKAPIHHVVEVVDLTALSNAELDALEAFTDAPLAAKRGLGWRRINNPARHRFSGDCACAWLHCVISDTKFPS